MTGAQVHYRAEPYKAGLLIAAIVVLLSIGVVIATACSPFFMRLESVAGYRAFDANGRRYWGMYASGGFYDIFLCEVVQLDKHQPEWEGPSVPFSMVGLILIRKPEVSNWSQYDSPGWQPNRVVASGWPFRFAYWFIDDEYMGPNTAPRADMMADLSPQWPRIVHWWSAGADVLLITVLGGAVTGCGSLLNKLRRYWMRIRRHSACRCVGCGYSMVGLRGADIRCPECGKPWRDGH